MFDGMDNGYENLDKVVVQLFLELRPLCSHVSMNTKLDSETIDIEC